ncbi:hypothetical protein GKQ77_27790 [Streptomyces sp. BG9H]|uniref:EfeO-type cupredoxin-like domain-containing protein n=1 Tax=Streptomyces anatolicus TaxID=2675858 RepID=A0ABS6YWJ4_9ACTN|nr:cupredoxin domain-containing protein [Streptomyces anatolicus]MBW5425319.1 hypothetical protein [Streptomyces anatolicus]
MDAGTVSLNRSGKVRLSVTKSLGNVLRTLVTCLVAASMSTLAVSPATPAPQAPQQVVVRVDDDRFDPEEVTINVGDKVVWRNLSDNNPASAKAQDGSFDIGYLMPGQSSEPVLFANRGTFKYYDEPRPYKTGTIVVK